MVLLALLSLLLTWLIMAIVIGIPLILLGASGTVVYYLIVLGLALLSLPILAQIWVIRYFVDVEMYLALPLVSVVILASLATTKTIIEIIQSEDKNTESFGISNGTAIGFPTVAICSGFLGQVWEKMELKYSWLQSNPNHFAVDYDCGEYIVACLDHTNPAGSSQVWIATLGIIFWYVGVSWIFSDLKDEDS
jgi:hypothetical protein